MRFAQLEQSVRRHRGMPTERNGVLHPALSELRRAYVHALRFHRRQRNSAGVPIVHHALARSCILASWGLSPGDLSTSLLYEALCEGTPDSKTLRQATDAATCALVDHAHTLATAHLHSAEMMRVEHMRQMFLTSSEDPRGLLILFADRLQLLREAEGMHPAEQRNLAHHTHTLYVPLARGLGMEALYTEMEERAFSILQPAAFQRLHSWIGAHREIHSKHLDAFRRRIMRLLRLQGIVAEVQSRVKALASIHVKLEHNRNPFAQLHDLLAVRVIVNSEADCYRVLSLFHAQFTPLAGRMKDYIVQPKPNGYRSLHTTILDKAVEGVRARFELQIRTHEMHLQAELGPAAHYAYKHGAYKHGAYKHGAYKHHARKRQALPGRAAAPLQELETLRTLRNRSAVLKQTHVAAAPVAVSSVDSSSASSASPFAQAIFVFTPMNEVVKLPPGATVLDFAYAIHSEVGHRCIGAQVKEQLRPLDTPLENGERVKVLTRRSQFPRSRWLRIATTRKALGRIRAFLAAQERERASVLAEDSPCTSNGRISTPSPEGAAKRTVKMKSPVHGLKSQAGKSLAQARAKDLAIEGIRDVVIRLARCCSPQHGDPIVGILSRERAISVHSQACANVTGHISRELVQVAWNR